MLDRIVLVELAIAVSPESSRSCFDSVQDELNEELAQMESEMLDAELLKTPEVPVVSTPAVATVGMCHLLVKLSCSRVLLQGSPSDIYPCVALSEERAPLLLAPSNRMPLSRMHVAPPLRLRDHDLQACLTHPRFPFVRLPCRLPTARKLRKRKRLAS